MKKIILIIDDDATSVFMHQIILRKAFGGEILIKEFCSAPLALTFLNEIKNPDVFNFSILLDIHMSEMTGWEFLDALEHNFRLNYRTHVITISNDPNDKLRSGIFHSVLSYTEKPLTMTNLAGLNLCRVGM